MLDDALLKQNHSRWLINHEASLQPNDKLHWVTALYIIQIIKSKKHDNTQTRCINFFEAKQNLKESTLYNWRTMHHTSLETYGSVQYIAIFSLWSCKIDVSRLFKYCGVCSSIPIQRAKNGWIRESFSGSSKVFKQFSRPATLKSITIDLFAMGADPFRLFGAWNLCEEWVYQSETWRDRKK